MTVIEHGEELLIASGPHHGWHSGSHSLFIRHRVFAIFLAPGASVNGGKSHIRPE
jgi:hypothetical protein